MPVPSGSFPSWITGTTRPGIESAQGAVGADRRARGSMKFRPDGLLPGTGHGVMIALARDADGRGTCNVNTVAAPWCWVYCTQAVYSSPRSLFNIFTNCRPSILPSSAREKRQQVGHGGLTARVLELLILLGVKPEGVEFVRLKLQRGLPMQIRRRWKVFFWKVGITRSITKQNRILFSLFSQNSSRRISESEIS